MPKVSLKAHALVALLLSILVAVAYAPIINLSFLSDDWAVIRLVTLPDGVTNWARNLNDFYTPLFDRSSKFRPLYSMSFALDFALYGTWSLPYHLTNLALHAVSSFFVYLLALEMVPGERRRAVSVTAGVLFALYPVHPEAVTWIAGRVDLICAVFYLPSMLLFLRWLRAGGRIYLGVSLVCFGLALLAKEMAVMLPALLFLLALYRRRGLATATANVLPFVLMLGAYLIFRTYVLSGLESVSLIDRDLDIARVVRGFLYRTLHMFVPLNFGLLPAGWRTFIDFIFVFWPIPVGIALLAAYYRGWTVGRFPILLFALYAVALTPVAPALNVDPTLKGSRWSYIPSAFLAIFIAYVLWAVFASRARRALLASVVVCGVFFAILLANHGPWLRAGEMTDRYLEAGKQPDLPVGYKGASAFGAKITWIAANRPPFKEP